MEPTETGRDSIRASFEKLRLELRRDTSYSWPRRAEALMSMSNLCTDQECWDAFKAAANLRDLLDQINDDKTSKRKRDEDLHVLISLVKETEASVARYLEVEA